MGFKTPGQVDALEKLSKLKAEMAEIKEAQINNTISQEVNRRFIERDRYNNRKFWRGLFRRLGLVKRVTELKPGHKVGLTPWTPGDNFHIVEAVEGNRIILTNGGALRRDELTKLPNFIKPYKTAEDLRIELGLDIVIDGKIVKTN